MEPPAQIVHAERVGRIRCNLAVERTRRPEIFNREILRIHPAETGLFRVRFGSGVGVHWAEFGCAENELAVRLQFAEIAVGAVRMTLVVIGGRAFIELDFAGLAAAVEVRSITEHDQQMVAFALEPPQTHDAVGRVIAVEVVDAFGAAIDHQLLFSVRGFERDLPDGGAEQVAVVGRIGGDDAGDFFGAADPSGHRGVFPADEILERKTQRVAFAFVVAGRMIGRKILLEGDFDLFSAIFERDFAPVGDAVEIAEAVEYLS
ncbi:hypothetical protein SDC9_82240 [bioreactor metagenome]|uniref:Uncharacterized protein n=1 Tax=bioreactor metagenome TaxID=1076179 RepID=A0A644Z4W1_9ZZZZ